MGFCRFSALVVMVGCASSGPEPVSAPAPHTPVPQASEGFESAYLLTWHQQRIGDATESLRPTGDGYEFVRTERISIRRGDQITRLRTRIGMELDDALSPTRVSVASESNGSTVRGEAHRDADGWRAHFSGAPVTDIPAAAVPLELVPLLLARDGTGRYEGPVMLAGYGFATGELYARPTDDSGRRVQLSLVIPSGVLTHTIELGHDGRLARVDAPGTVESYRVDAIDLDATFEPPELVDAASIPVSGTAPRGNIVHLVVDGVTAPEPPVLPAQALRRDGTRWDVTLAPGFNSGEVTAREVGDAVVVDDELRVLAGGIISESRARTPMAQLRALALYTDRMLENDLSAPPPDARSAFALGRGDCTTHSTLFAAFAAARGFDVRLVTGFRLTRDDDGHRLVRHRWALVQVEDRWVAIDPTYGEAPAAAVNFGLAVHGTNAHQIAMVDELVFAGFRDARAWFR